MCGCLCVFMLETETMYMLFSASSLLCVFLLCSECIDLGTQTPHTHRLFSTRCHIDQCHCSLFPLLNIPWAHHTVFDLHPHLLLLFIFPSILFSLCFPFPSSPLLLLSFSLLQPPLCFLPSSAQWRRNLFMMRARGLSASTITRLYCKTIKLLENGLGMIYSAVYVQWSLVGIFPGPIF